MQTFDTLMLRLTTNVTVSPASSARRSSAAWRMSSIASGRVSANSAVSSSGLSAAPPLARLDDVEHALRDPVRADVAWVDAQTLGQCEALGGQPLADLVRRRERVL